MNSNVLYVQIGSVHPLIYPTYSNVHIPSAQIVSKNPSKTNPIKLYVLKISKKITSMKYKSTNQPKKH